MTTKRKLRALPPIPKAIQTPLGPMPVHLTEAQPDWPNGGVRSGGYYDSRQFRMFIANDMALLVQWHILWHERGHQIADIGGLQFADEAHEEQFCVAFATMMLNEMLYG
jgi:hypothetical protein